MSQLYADKILRAAVRDADLAAVREALRQGADAFGRLTAVPGSTDAAEALIVQAARQPNGKELVGAFLDAGVRVREAYGRLELTQSRLNGGEVKAVLSTDETTRAQLNAYRTAWELSTGDLSFDTRLAMRRAREALIAQATPSAPRSLSLG